MPESIYELSGRRVLVTGGAGFIGSCLVRTLLNTVADVEVTTLDLLTYAGNLTNLVEVKRNPRHRFVQGDVCDVEIVGRLMRESDAVFHLAAETHVDRSIADGISFSRTDVVGTTVLLEAARKYRVDRFLHVSTDEVYGEIVGATATEDHPLVPRNPYSASKAGADLLAQAYNHTHDLPVLVARPSNHYGPYQYPEKFIPLFIVNATEGRRLPLYGDGRQRREWTHVKDGAAALLRILEAGTPGTVYNVTSSEEYANLEVARAICNELDVPHDLIETVQDRPGHDRRYAISADRIRSLGWRPRVSFEQGLVETIRWYQDNRAWWEPVVSSNPSYARWIKDQYGSGTAG